MGITGNGTQIWVSFSIHCHGLYSPCVSHSVVSDSVTPWTVAHQAPLSIEFSRQEYRSGFPCPSPVCSNSFLYLSFKEFTSLYLYAAAAKSLQSCLTLHDPTDGSPPGSPVPGILQARTLEWVAISFPNVWKWKVKVKSLSRVRLLATPWTAAYQAHPPMGFSRQE